MCAAEGLDQGGLAVVDMAGGPDHDRERLKLSHDYNGGWEPCRKQRAYTRSDLVYESGSVMDFVE